MKIMTTKEKIMTNKGSIQLRSSIDLTGLGTIEPKYFWEELDCWIDNQLRYNSKKKDFYDNWMEKPMALTIIGRISLTIQSRS
jgi:hypothetical protein